MKWLRSMAACAFLVSNCCAVAYADGQSVTTDPNSYRESNMLSDPEGAIRSARELIAQGNLEGAIASLQRYVYAHGREVAPRRFLGDLYYRDGKLDKAAFIYETLLRENAYDKETHNRLGAVYAAENRVDDAIAQFQAALPGTDSVGDLVALHIRKGDIANYRARMEAEAASDRNSADLQSELGQIYGALRMIPEAIREFRLALDLDSQSLTAMNGLGLAYLDVHNYALARNEFNACLRIDPPDFTCLNNLGATNLESGNFTDAEQELNHAHTVAPERPEALVNFGYLADARGDWKGAVAYYARAIAVGPYLHEAYIDLAIAYEQHKLFPLAEAALLKGVAAAPDDGRLHVLLARAYDAQGQRDRAVSEYRIAAKSRDEDAARIAESALGRSPQ